MSKALLVAFGIGCGALVAALPGAEAAPVSTGVAKLDAAIPAQTITVQHRRWGGGGGRGYRGGGYYRGYGYRGYGYRGYGYWGAGAGFLAGALVGAAVANPYYYYGGPYYYGPTYYAPPPAVYRAPPGGSCWIPTDTTRGYGYYGPC